MTEEVAKSNNLENVSTSSQRVALTGPNASILGIKAGMTQVYNKNGDLIPVTVIDLKPTVVTQIKNQQRDGYSAVQVGFLEKKTQRASKSEKGHFKKSGFPGFYHCTEFRVDSVEGLAEGTVLSPEFVKEGDYIDITGVSKGKGFQGGMKRYNMAGGFKTHGASLSHRSLGSIGNRADPGKCFKNKKMPGHMGHEKVTIQNLKVVTVDLENNVLLVNGSVPGPKNSVVTVKKAVKA